MNNKIEPKKWIITYFFSFMVISFLMFTFSFLYDVNMKNDYYENRSYILNPLYINGGLINNTDYDTVILGSSMTQNFKKSLFMDELELNIIKVTAGGMPIEAIVMYNEMIVNKNKASTIILALDFPIMAKGEEKLDNYPLYMTDRNVLNDFKYYMGFETWMRFIPISIALSLFNYRIGSFNSDLSLVGEWYNDYDYGKEVLIEIYDNSIRNKNVYSEYNYEQVKFNIDKIIEMINRNSDIEYIVFVPPYSSLYWYQMKVFGNLENFLETKNYFIKEASFMNNITIYDFQYADFTSDLDYYKDLTHYNLEISNFMIKSFSHGDFITKVEIMESNNMQLINRIEFFYSQNKEWID